MIVILFYREITVGRYLDFTVFYPHAIFCGEFELFQSGKQYSFDKFIDIIPNLKDGIETADNAFQPLLIPSNKLVGDLVRIERPIKTISTPQIILNKFVNPTIAGNELKLPKRDNLNRELTVNPRYTHIDDKLIDEIIVSHPDPNSPVPETKNKLPVRKPDFRYAFPEFILPRRRLLFPPAWENPDAKPDDEDDHELSQEIKVNSVPGVGGFGYGTGGDAVVYSTPHWSSSRGAGTYGGSGSGGGSWDDSGNHYTGVDPCDPYNPTTICYDYCAVNPDDDFCCDQTDPYSDCYVSCPSVQIPGGSVLVDPKSFSKFLEGHVPSDATSQSIFLSTYTDTYDVVHYQLSGAYTDSQNQVTAFSSFDIGWGGDNETEAFYLRNDPNYTQVGSVINYSGGTITNYQNNYGRYAVWTPSPSGDETVFPNVNIVDTAVTEGAAMTIPDPDTFGWTSTIHMSTTSNGLLVAQHEYGHHLQSQMVGLAAYANVMLSSFFSATFKPSEHHTYWTETAANALAKLYFGPGSLIGQSTYFKSNNCQ